MRLADIICTATVAILLSLNVARGAHAQDAPAAIEFDHSSVRLLPGAKTADGKFQAGLEIRLKPEWKTYWRMPGDSGIPPQFDWKSSTNLKSVSIAWPAPKRYVDAAGETIGYKDHVVFPLTVQSEKANSPVELNLTLYYAICRDICIPAKASVGLLLDHSVQNGDSRLISAFQKRVPREPKSGDFMIADVRVAVNEAGHSLVIEITGGKAPADADILVEGFDDAYFRKPKRMSQSGYHLVIDGLKSPEALKGKKLKLTLLTGEVRLVQNVTIH